MGTEARRIELTEESPAENRAQQAVFEDAENRIFRELCEQSQMWVPKDGRTVMELVDEAVGGDSEQSYTKNKFRIIEVAEKATRLARVEFLKRNRSFAMVPSEKRQHRAAARTSCDRVPA